MHEALFSDNNLDAVASFFFDFLSTQVQIG
jgi:hypothetical protein